MSCGWLLVLALSCTNGSAADTPSGFSPEAWRQAVDRQSDTWSREALLRQFAKSTYIDGMSRSEIIRSLGGPGVSHQIYDPRAGVQARIDLYRLSAKNDGAFRIDYDANDKVKGNFIEGSSCACELCELARADPGSVRMETLEGSVLKKDPDGLRRTVTLSELESRLGRPGRHHTAEARIGGRMWDIYSDLWHIVGKPHGFFIASATLPRTEPKPFDQAPAEDIAVIEAWPECLPQ